LGVLLGDCSGFNITGRPSPPNRGTAAIRWKRLRRNAASEDDRRHEHRRPDHPSRHPVHILEHMLKRSLVLALLTIACGHHAPAPPVPPPATWRVDAIACATAGPVPYACAQPIPGATIQMHGPDGYLSQPGDDAGYAVFALPPGPAGQGRVAGVSRYAAGMVGRRRRADLLRPSRRVVLRGHA